MTVTVVSGRGAERPVRCGYRDPRSGLEIVIATPTADPDGWQDYLAGAWRSYRAHGVERALDLDEIADGRSSSLVFLARTPDGRPVGGMRAHGPYTAADESHAVVEWRGDPGLPTVRSMIADRLADGVVETKGGWVAQECPARRELVACLARAPIHAASVFGARWALGTAAEHTLGMWTGAGAVVPPHLDPVPYPDDRYRTTMVWWDLDDLGPMAPGEREALADEAEQLATCRVPGTASRRSAP